MRNVGLIELLDSADPDQPAGAEPEPGTEAGP
jgi:hypothetical protein